MTQEVEDFWKEYERSTGETVTARAMGQWLGPGAPKEGIWGILILTDRSFHFLGRRSENWVSGLLSLKSRPDAEPVEFRVPREDLISLEMPEKRGLARLLGPAFPESTLSWKRPGETEPARAVFTVDNQGGFLEALRKAT